MVFAVVVAAWHALASNAVFQACAIGAAVAGTSTAVCYELNGANPCGEYRRNAISPDRLGGTVPMALLGALNGLCILFLPHVWPSAIRTVIAEHRRFVEIELFSPKLPEQTPGKRVASSGYATATPTPAPPSTPYALRKRTTAAEKAVDARA